MLSILLPVDGSDNSLRAVQHIVDRHGWFSDTIKLHLLNVQVPIASGAVKTFISKKQLDGYYRDEGVLALGPACALLDAANMPHEDHIGVGQPAETILDYARDKKCGLVVMGTQGSSALGLALLGSVASQVLSQATFPVILVK